MVVHEPGIDSFLLTNGVPTKAEDGVTPVAAAGTTSGSLADFAQTVFLPGEFAMRTLTGHYITAINGGGRATEPSS